MLKCIKSIKISGCHFDPKAEKAYFLAGSSFPNNPCLRVLNLSKTKLKPVTDLSSKKAKNTVIRSSALAEDGVTFITGSENGLLCIWAKDDGSKKDQDETSLKAKDSKTNNKTPYAR